MSATVTRLSIALGLALAMAAPALASEEPWPDWILNRAPGAPLPDERAPDVAGWLLGPEVSSPYALGFATAYFLPVKPFTLKAGADWGILSDGGVTALKFQDWRIYGSAMYFFIPGSNDGPYVEVGLDALRSHGGVLALQNWPVVPHLGFGTVLRFGSETVWDIDFSATGNGLLTLEGGLVFGAKNENNGPTQPWEPDSP